MPGGFEQNGEAIWQEVGTKYRSSQHETLLRYTFTRSWRGHTIFTNTTGSQQYLSYSKVRDSNECELRINF